MHDQAVKQAEVEHAQKIAGQAGELLNTTQFEVIKERIIAGERVGWFCAGAISLSFTLIGYLFSNSEAKPVLSQELLYGVPLVGFLIVGWVNLSTAVVSSLLIRLLNAAFMNYAAVEHWTLRNRESKEKTLEAIEAGVQFSYTDVTSDEAAISNIKESKKNYSELEEIAKRRASAFLKCLNLAQASIYVGAIVGLLILAIFLMVVTYRLVFS